MNGSDAGFQTPWRGSEGKVGLLRNACGERSTKDHGALGVWVSCCTT